MANYSIITNLTDTNLFTNKFIEKIYKVRWQIETYFKFTKKNTKFGFNKEKRFTSHKNMRICISIVNIIIKYLIHIYINSITKNTKSKHNNFLNSDPIKKVNFTSLINGLYTKFLTYLIKNNYNKKQLIKFVACYFDTYNNKENRTFPRKSLIPFSKWYVKKYHNI